MLEKLTLELSRGEPTVLVKGQVGDVVETFRVPPASLTKLFIQTYTTGYLPVSHDGVIYLEERGGLKLVVVQRAARENHTLKWQRSRDRSGDPREIHGMYVPYLYGFYLLEPHAGHYRVRKERIYCSTGGSLGSATPLYSTNWMGNVYLTPSLSNSNICWGNTQVIQGGLVTIASVLNLLNDFVLQPFNSDLGSSISTWESVASAKSFVRFSPNSWTMGEQVERMWQNDSPC